MEVTEKWLGEIGGWAAMKAARGLADSGLASVQSAEPGLIRGVAGGGKMKFACGLRVRSRSDVDNLCTCPSSRRGMICEHSLAVGLMVVRAGTAQKPAATEKTAVQPPVVAAPRELKPQRAKGTYQVFLPDTTLQGRAREPLAVFVKFTPDGGSEESLLAAWLAEKGMAERTLPLSLSGSDLSQFVQVLAGHPRVVAGRPSGGGRALAVAETPMALPLAIEGADGQVRLRFSVAAQQPIGAGALQAWWYCSETVTLFALPAMAPEMQALLVDAVAGGAAFRPLAWLVQHREALAEAFQVHLHGALLERFHVAPVPCQFTLLLDGSLQAVEARMEAEFQGRRWHIPGRGRMDSEGIFPIQDQVAESTFYVPNIDGEDRLIRTLEVLGFSSQDQRLWRLAGAGAVLRFYASDLPRLSAKWRVREGDKWLAATRGLARIVPTVRSVPPVGQAPVDRAGGGWLSMEFSYQAPDGFRLPRSEVLRLVRSGQRVVQAKGGKRYLLDAQSTEEFEETLRDVPVELTPEGARIHSLHASYFLPEDELSALPLKSEAELRPLLGELGANLRSYQMTGVRWIDALIGLGRGGVLGDEMGLGKTVQSIAAVRIIEQQRSAAKQPVLVVCPKSLVGNWQAEFERFAPRLRVTAVHGPGRAALLGKLSDSDVILTTYQLIVRDLESYGKMSFSLVVLDEASYIRNPDTDASKAVRALRADARLALTGTPVENSTRDLWAIFQFALPGYLGSRENFRERFELPIQNNLDTPAGQAASERLKKLIRPYFLRRTKREVLRELPDKIEQVLWCDPSPAQAEVYRRLLEEGREEIKSARKRSGQAGAKMTMFTVLLRLRQACCDLRLTGMGAETLAGLERDDLSGKWPMWSERLDEIMEGGGKVLIFSQFVQYLRLVRDNLDVLKIKYSYIDGSSQDRDAQVRTFQTDPERRAFVISLKAGGYGLNLTAADHVMLMDPWWNPAVEAQAIDRAHRIGQQRVVTAYRLAMRGTVEERILALQAHKRGLVEAAFDEQTPLMAGLQDADLEQLLRS